MHAVMENPLRRRRSNRLKALLALLSLVLTGTFILASRGALPTFRHTLPALNGLPPSSAADDSTKATSPSPTDAQISVAYLASFGEQHLAEQVQAYDTAYATEEHRIKFKYPSLMDYRNAMGDAWDYFFQLPPDNLTGPLESPAGSQWREAVLQQLEVASVIPTLADDDELPRKIFTTSKDAVADYVKEFKGWTKLSPGWEVVNYHDDKTVKWLKETFSSQNGESEARLVHEFASLNRGVLKGEWRMLHLWHARALT
jgi:hypothetical protein